MNLRLVYDGKLYALPKAIASYKELEAEITKLIESELRDSYALHYCDEENDIVILSDERDFRTLINCSSDHHNTSTLFLLKQECNSDDEYEIIRRTDTSSELYSNRDDSEEWLYDQFIREKAQKLKQLIPENNIDVYLHYISLDPTKSIEELAEDYLSYYATQTSRAKI